MFEVREIMVSVSPLERGLRGVLKLAIRRNDNTPPLQRGKVTLRLLILVEFGFNLYSFVFSNNI